MDLTSSQIETIGGTSYIDLPSNHKSVISPQNQGDNYCALCSIVIKLVPLTTNLSVISSHVKLSNESSSGDIDLTKKYKVKIFKE